MNCFVRVCPLRFVLFITSPFTEKKINMEKILFFVEEIWFVNISVLEINILVNGWMPSCSLTNVESSQSLLLLKYKLCKVLLCFLK